MPVLLCHFPITKKWGKAPQKMITSAKKSFHRCPGRLPLEDQEKEIYRLPEMQFPQQSTNAQACMMLNMLSLLPFGFVLREPHPFDIQGSVAITHLPHFWEGNLTVNSQYYKPYRQNG
jgi:hypothetical protein